VPYRRFQHRWWLHILLFLLTVVTTTSVGVDNYVFFASDLGTKKILAGVDQALWLNVSTLWREGLFYSAAILGILGAHEMGHYMACRRYNVDATLPFFLPFPSLSGTLGAVIRIRQAFPNRKVLFDVAVAGPIAGFVVLVPILALAVHYSRLVPMRPIEHGTFLGEPLLFKAIVWMKFGKLGDAYELNLHPMGFAAWFGMLATAWNLLPFSQLDGGHLAYAVLGDRSRHVSVATVAGAVVMCFVSVTSWMMMTLIMLVALYFLGPRHPPVLNEYEPLGKGRYALAIFAAIMFVLCFMPVPVELK
jgi:membrane-associated protease RseP (regulator of RpoE activity)